MITYNRRGFGQNDKLATGYSHDILADDLAEVINELDLRQVTLVGFFMERGEVARYLAKYGPN